MEQTFHQAQLPDGRFVRMRELSSADQERAASAAHVVLAGREGIDTASLQRQNRELIKLALLAVSAPKPLRVPAKDADGKPITKAGVPATVPFSPTDLTDADWRKLSYGDLETSYDDLFNAKARILLQRLYDRVHVPQEEDMDAFFGTIQSGVATT